MTSKIQIPKYDLKSREYDLGLHKSISSYIFENVDSIFPLFSDEKEESYIQYNKPTVYMEEFDDRNIQSSLLHNFMKEQNYFTSDLEEYLKLIDNFKNYVYTVNQMDEEESDVPATSISIHKIKNENDMYNVEFDIGIEINKREKINRLTRLFDQMREDDDIGMYNCDFNRQFNKEISIFTCNSKYMYDWNDDELSYVIRNGSELSHNIHKIMTDKK